MKTSTFLTFSLGMGMQLTNAAPINTTKTDITVGNPLSNNLTITTAVDNEPVKRDGTNWEWWCDYWWEPICGGTPPASAFNAPFDATTGEVINTTTAEIFTELSRVNPVKRHHPSFWKGDPCCTLISCHRKKECDIPEWDESQYYQRCGWCDNPVPPPPGEI
ncbi:hypothetical protein KCU61_g8337, partial [Aureobasidium melanogenum]